MFRLEPTQDAGKLRRIVLKAMALVHNETVPLNMAQESRVVHQGGPWNYHNINNISPVAFKKFKTLNIFSGGFRASVGDDIKLGTGRNRNYITFRLDIGLEARPMDKMQALGVNDWIKRWLLAAILTAILTGDGGSGVEY